MPDVTLKVETSPTWKEILVQALCCCARWILRGFLLFIGFYLASLWLPISAKAAEVTIPRAAQQYRATLVRAAHATWGLDAPETGKPAPFNPGWSLRALCVYDKWLWDRVAGHSDFERMAFTLSAYNGGLGWVNRDRKKARALGVDDRRWFGAVENVNAGRSKAAFRENRNYPRLILEERQYAYIKAGWGPGVEDEARL